VRLFLRLDVKLLLIFKSALEFNLQQNGVKVIRLEHREIEEGDTDGE